MYTLNLATLLDPTLAQEVASLRDASAVLAAYRDAGGFGVSEALPGFGEVHRCGALVARVAYNGRVFREGKRDLAQHARAEGRKEFVCRYVAVSTRRRADREAAGGLRVRRDGRQWVLDMPGVAGSPVLARGVEGVYERVHRSAAGWLTQRAEEFRAAALEGPCGR